MITVRQGSTITSNGENPQKGAEKTSEGETLVEATLRNIICDNEGVRAAFTSPDGVRRVVDGDSVQVDSTVVLTVTDRRILVIDAVGDAIDRDTGSISYSDIAGVSFDSATNSIEWTTADGNVWRFTLPSTNPSVVDAVVRHLQWVGEFRRRLLTCKNDVDIAAGQIRDHAAEMNWDEAEDIYEKHRDRVDQLICAAQWTKPIDVEHLAPELTSIERTLEQAHARLFIERSESQLELSRQRIENGDYDLGAKPLRRAREYYERARSQAEAVKRRDDFQFGVQRELEDELDSLEWEIDDAAAKPVQRANQAKVAAKNAEQRADAIDHWESAYSRYAEVVKLNWGEGRSDYAGDAAEARKQKEEAAENLVDLYREAARNRWNSGMEQFHEDNDVKAALQTCIEARQRLERAIELASEVAPDRVEDLEERLDGMERKITRMRESSVEDAEHRGRERQSSGGSSGPRQAENSTEGDEDIDIPSIDELTQLDTHHEITLEIQNQDANTNPDGSHSGRAQRKNGALFSEPEH